MARFPLLPLALLLLASGPAAAESLPPACLWKFEHYLPLAGEATCMCGPPGDGLLSLEPLTDELGIERPKYQGTIIQQTGGLVGTYSYAGNSNVCFAAQHAGLLEDSATVGGIVTFRESSGCERYEGMTQNGMRSQESGPRAVSFHFPRLTDGGCPGERGYGNRYAGGPALEVLLGMLSLALPADAVRYQRAESQGVEAFAIERLFLRPPGGMPIAIGRLAVERIDMEYAILKIPPRYLTLSLEGVSLPSAYLGPAMEALFEGRRLAFDASLDYRYNLDRGTLELLGASLAIENEATLRLRGWLHAITAAAVHRGAPGTVELGWLRLIWDDAGLLSRLLPRWWNRGEALAPAALREALLPALAQAAADGDPRTRAALALFAGLLRDLELPPGRLELLLQPPEPLAFDEVVRLLEEDPAGAAERLRGALLYAGLPDHSLAAGAASLRPAAAVFAVGEAVRLEVTGAGELDGGVALHLAGAAPGASDRGWFPLEGPGGPLDLGTPTPGFYEAVLWLGEPNARQPAAFAWFVVE